MFQRKPRHQHDWKLIETNHVDGFDTPKMKAEGGDPSVILRELAYIAQGYYSYVFKCECGEVMVKRS